MRCHYCLESADVTDGVVAKHRDHFGRVCAMTGQPPFVWDETAIREAIPNRSGGICECCCKQRATDMHHRKNRSVGGEWTPANILYICRICHSWITREGSGPNSAAIKRGLAVRRSDNPERIPVQRLTGEVVFLSDDLVPPRKLTKGNLKGKR